MIPWPYWNIDVRDDGWVFFGDWFVPKEFQIRKKILREFRELEKKLVKMKFKGWLGGASIDDYKMIRLIEGVGGTAYFCDGESIAFYKELNDEKESSVPPPCPDNGVGAATASG